MLPKRPLTGSHTPKWRNLSSFDRSICWSTVTGSSGLRRSTSSGRVIVICSALCSTMLPSRLSPNGGDTQDDLMLPVNGSHCKCVYWQRVADQEWNDPFLSAGNCNEPEALSRLTTAGSDVGSTLARKIMGRSRSSLTSSFSPFPRRRVLDLWFDPSREHCRRRSIHFDS